MINEITLYRLISKSPFRLLRHFNTCRYPRIVLVYHGISPNHPDCLDPRRFRDQVSYLMSHYEIRTIDKMISENAENPRPTAAVTFDDAYVNIMENALPILYENRIPAMIYAPTNYLGKSSKWDRGSSMEIMTVSHLRSLLSMGFATGSHTQNHVRVRGMDAVTLKREIGDSKNILEDILGVDVSSFAYPHGGGSDFDEDAMIMVRKSGYSSAATTLFGRVNNFSNRFEIRRVIVWPGDTLQDLKMKMEGHYDWLIPKEMAVHKLRRILRASK